MKITLLNENSVGRKNHKLCLAEWGLSVFIEVNDIRVLLDSGHTDVYKRNAKKLSIDLNQVDFVVLSHNHWDHTGGLRFHEFKEKKKIFIHPQIFDKLPKDESDKISKDFEVISSTKPLEFSKDIFYLGEIPRLTAFEKGGYKSDPMLDDSAIAIKTSEGVVVISGCSHSGICNICEYAKKITGQKLLGVIGGFHLFEEDMETVMKTVEYFKVEKPKYLFPMHCVDHAAMAHFYNNFQCKKYSSGDTFEI
ncbi:MAG: Metallo-beta-lactamase domain protein [Candidatus Roizmanbacteria bacterium GW2011_GWA2_35_19]|uniref:Metallo-beta-lactamase domain protein n=2 Tax=Candidatus Roizmaniibacteriota TaxID=1752723 RepID=A0A0G0BTH7_9BACT|nr:MAG: Metallo-beta-lactamase domain protein [Candidatus Roizmanbacteria bacterium GW2011_GWC2_35_12]KKP72729.1 MAG: Metallo-beta-lactamase domain protein [Candidatus Roizmanbacteria bacterium GW2011_GWA2_35_19]